MWASQRGHVETVKILLKYGGDPNLTATVSLHDSKIVNIKLLW